jgi:hypothetical protein
MEARMKTPIWKAVVIGLSILTFSGSIWAQQRGESIAQLREQIVYLEKIEADPSTTQEVKDINRRFLEERRVQLQDLLKSRISALRKYETAVQATLTSNEAKVLENTIRDLEKNLQDMELRAVVPAPLELSSREPAEVSITPPLAVSEKSSSPSRSSKSIKVSSVPSNASLPLLPVPAPLDGSSNPYNDAPPLLLNVIDRVTDDIIQADAGAPPAIPATYPVMLFYTAADAVVPSETAAQAHSIRSLDAYQYLGETARTDKQIGAPAKATGTTSAIEKPGFARLLGVAIEKGAIIQDVNGSSLTLSTSPYVLYTLDGGDTAENYQRASILNRIGLSANFNVEDNANVLASARRSRLTQWSIKTRLMGDRSTRSKAFQEFWNENVRGPIEARLNAITGALIFFDDSRFDPLMATEAGLVAQIGAFTGGSDYASMNVAEKKKKLTNIILAYLKGEVLDKIHDGTFTIGALDRSTINDKLVKALAIALQNINDIRGLLDDRLDDIDKGPLASLSYVNHRQATGSDYSEGMFLFEQDNSAFRTLKLVGNLGTSFYHKPNRLMNQQTVRDISAALSFEGKKNFSFFSSFSDSPDLSKITFAFTGNYQRIFENKRVLGRKADVAGVQFKLDIPIFAGASLPFSVSYSNATEQNRKVGVRVNFGLNFDIDKLFAVTQIAK